MSEIKPPAVKPKKRHIGSRYNPGRWRSVAILETLAQEIDKLVDKERYQSVCNFVDQAIRAELKELEVNVPQPPPIKPSSPYAVGQPVPKPPQTPPPRPIRRY
jgi:hypothetical protein